VRNKRDEKRKGRIQTIPIANDVILYLTDSKNSTKNLKIINSFIKIAGYINKIWKSVVFLYANHKALRKKAGKQYHLQ
jgi:hypothetical protein